jgi:multidrug efflux system membrane fusion protein
LYPNTYLYYDANMNAKFEKLSVLSKILLVLVIAIGGCHGQPPKEPAPALVVAGTVHALGRGPGDSFRYPVEVAPRYANAMSFRIAGKLIERTVRLGDTVHSGQIVARLDPIDAERSAQSAEAALQSAEHRLVFAKQQLDRDQAQTADNLIAPNQLEQSQDSYAGALAGRAQALAQKVIAANALAYTTLRADHDGIITSENADTGQVVAAGQTVYGLAWSGDTDVTLDAAASDLARIRLGQSARVSFPALAGRQFDARVREIAPAADLQSRTYRVKLTLTAPELAIRLGMTGDATLTAGPTEQIDAQEFEIPATAVFHHGSDPAVWIVRSADAVLELRTVAVRRYTQGSAILTSGLQEGETIVLAGVHTVYAGQHVTPTKALFADEIGSTP